MAERAKSTEVEEFMSLYAKVREYSDDDPDCVEQTAASDDEFGEICFKLSTLVLDLGRAMEEYPDRFVSPVGKDFIKSWRDYEQRYAAPIAGVWLARFQISPSGKQATSHYDAKHHAADYFAQETESAIETSIASVHDKFLAGDYDTEENGHWMSTSWSGWRFLRHSVGLDIRGILRRRALVPFVLVPHHVSARYGSNEQSSLLGLLHQAQDAFIFGVPFAAVALMRAILEATLVNHYAASGIDLKAKIDSAPDDKLPWRLRQELHRLRRFANRVLHVRGEPIKEPPSEEAMVAHLHHLRDLLEGAPVGR